MDICTVPAPTSTPAKLLQRVTLTTKLWLSVTSTLLLALILLSGAFQADQRHLTEQQLKTLGNAISQQTAASSAALILAGDELSLSINLQQLTTLTQISGAEVFDPKGNSLAQSGLPSALFLEQPILSEQTELGSIRIHLNPGTDAYTLTLPLTLAMAAVTILLLLAMTLLLSLHLSRPLNALLAATQQICTDTPIAPLDPQRHDQFGLIAQLLNQRFAEPLAMPAAETSDAPAPSEHTANPAADSDSTALTLAGQKPGPSASPDNPAATTLDPSQNHDQAATTPEPEQQPEQQLDQQLDQQPDQQPDQQLQTADNDHATQGYLFYINHHVGGSDTLTRSEREQLLVRYRKALEQVARLYKGGFDEDALGNWYVKFSPLPHDQCHGINALCAAQLFNALYRGINAQAIRSFSPALNMKLVLLCGPTSDFDALAEDALLLSDQIQDNDLITHEALYQVPALHERLLGSAKYRKFDDNTYLLSALNDDYQTLIDRQALHFLKQSG
ncbi:MAG: hypothetical protein V7629_02765 [Motiliproteus sp.]